LDLENRIEGRLSPAFDFVVTQSFKVAMFQGFKVEKTWIATPKSSMFLQP